MCGICGILTVDSGFIPDRHLLERMRDSITHRGPDGAGLYLAPGVGLGHRRLSIVDVAHGQQPMYSEGRRFVIVYNGEVFNHPTLQPELAAAGVHYRTRSDTETVLHLYERLGERAVERMRGVRLVETTFEIAEDEIGRLELRRDLRERSRRVRDIHQVDVAGEKNFQDHADGNPVGWISRYGGTRANRARAITPA